MKQENKFNSRKFIVGLVSMFLLTLLASIGIYLSIEDEQISVTSIVNTTTGCITAVAIGYMGGNALSKKNEKFYTQEQSNLNNNSDITVP